MRRLDTVLTQASRWLFVVRFVPAAITAVAVAAAAILALRIAQQLLGFTVDWTLTWAASMGGALLMALIVVFATRPSRFIVAQHLDERGDLREALSTAVWLERAKAEGQASVEGDEQWDAAASRHAERVAERVTPRGLIPVVVPRWWAAPAVLAASFFAVGLFPQGALLSGGDQPQAATDPATEADIREVASEMEEAKDVVRQAITSSPELEAILKQLEADAEPNGRSAEEMRRDAARQLTAAKDAMDELAEGPDAQALDAIRERLAGTRVPQGATPELAELSKALQLGDFARAAALLQELQAKLAAGELTPEQQEALAKALEQLAQQLEQAANQQNALQQALKQAGLNQNLANASPQQLQQAIQNASHLTQQQKQQLQQMAQAQQKAQQQLQQAAGACRNCANGMRAGQQGSQGNQGSQGQQNSQGQQAQQGQQQGQQGQGQQGQSASQALGQLAQQLQQLGATQQQVSQARAASSSLSQSLQNLGQCSGGGQGNPFASMFAEGGGGSGSQPPMPGMRQKHQQVGAMNATRQSGGQGAGSTGGAALANEAADPAAVDLYAAQDDVQIVQGEIVSTEFVDAEGVLLPEAVQQLSQAVVRAERTANDAVANNETTYPAEYHDAIREYFAQLSGRVREAAENSGSTEESSAKPSGGGTSGE